MKELLLKGLQKIDKQLNGELDTTLSKGDLKRNRAKLIEQLEEFEDNALDFTGNDNEILGI